MMRLKISKYWSSYFVIKAIYMFLALYVYSSFTSLGDTERYLAGSLSIQAFYNSTAMMDTIAGGINSLFGGIVANFFFMLLSFYGIYYSVSRLQLSPRKLFFILFMLSLPSFGIWTSVASKEAVGVFFLGILAGNLINYIKEQTVDLKLSIFAIYLCLLFKPQYMLGLVSLFIFIFVTKILNLKGIGRFLLLIVFFILSFVLLYLFSDVINELSFIIPQHFSADASSTRDNKIWLEDNDIFINAPYGMYIAFVGPTLSEALSRPTHLLVWLESLFIIILFLISCSKLIGFSLHTRCFNIYTFGLFITVTTWILFVNYPFGALNPGSAVRYRENYYAFLVVIFYFSYLESFRNRNLIKVY